MGNLYLVRHGQASFGAADYDNLSELGHRQSLRLGEYFAHKGLQFDAVLTGTLKRHAQTWAGITRGMRAAGSPHGVQTASGGGTSHAVESVGVTLWPGLNEYESEAVINSVHPEPRTTPDTPERYRHHFRLLRDGLTQWMNGVVSPKGMPSYDDFKRGIVSALDHVRQSHSGNVLIVSSGGPISTAVGHVLGTTPETTIELNFRIRNSAITEFAFTPKRHMLLTFNTLPHLDSPDYADWISYA